MKDITVQELKEKLDKQDNFILIDVREPHEYEEYNIGGELIPLGSVPEAVPAMLEDHKDEEVIVYCRSGSRSAAAQHMLQQGGMTKVRNLEGGVLAWIEAFEK